MGNLDLSPAKTLTILCVSTGKDRKGERFCSPTGLFLLLGASFLGASSSFSNLLLGQPQTPQIKDSGNFQMEFREQSR
jgi:hypothetical protein